MARFPQSPFRGGTQRLAVRRAGKRPAYKRVCDELIDPVRGSISVGGGHPGFSTTPEGLHMVANDDESPHGDGTVTGNASFYRYVSPDGDVPLRARNGRGKMLPPPRRNALINYELRMMNSE